MALPVCPLLTCIGLLTLPWRLNASGDLDWMHLTCQTGFGRYKQTALASMDALDDNHPPAPRRVMAERWWLLQAKTRIRYDRARVTDHPAHEA